MGGCFSRTAGAKDLEASLYNWSNHHQSANTSPSTTRHQPVVGVEDEPVVTFPASRPVSGGIAAVNPPSLAIHRQQGTPLFFESMLDEGPRPATMASDDIGSTRDRSRLLTTAPQPAAGTTGAPSLADRLSSASNAGKSPRRRSQLQHARSRKSSFVRMSSKSSAGRGNSGAFPESMDAQAARAFFTSQVGMTWPFAASHNSQLLDHAGSPFLAFGRSVRPPLVGQIRLIVPCNSKVRSMLLWNV